MSLTSSDHRSFFQSRFTQFDELACGLSAELDALRDCLTPFTADFAMRVEQVSRTAAEIQERLHVFAGELFSGGCGLIVDPSGREWSILQGTSGDQSLTPVPATPWLIERWKAFYRPRERQPSAPPPPGR